MAQNACYKEVTKFAAELCSEFVALDGEQIMKKIEGGAEGTLAAIFNKLLSIKAFAKTEITASEYRNILISDIPRTIHDNQNCRLTVAKTFYDKICPDTQDSSGKSYSVHFLYSAVHKDAINETRDNWPNATIFPGQRFVIYDQAGGCSASTAQNDYAACERGADGSVRAVIQDCGMSKPSYGAWYQFPYCSQAIYRHAITKEIHHTVDCCPSK